MDFNHQDFNSGGFVFHYWLFCSKYYIKEKITLKDVPHRYH